MKQTAVEQFIEQLEQQGNSWENASIGRMNISIKIEDYLKLIEQAKKMEKQEQKSNWMGGYLTCAMKDHNLSYGKEYLNLLENKEIKAEEYYNETFKSE
jgi:hypothetical protein